VVDPPAQHSLVGLVRGASAASWWMGGLFGVGSLCFALGSMPLYFDHIDAAVVASTFFVGSIFFTSAALVQFGVAGWRPDGGEWWAAAVQLLGTFFFNISTFAATLDSLDLEEETRLIWAPDVFGSICFLVASWLAYLAVCTTSWRRVEPTVDWNIGALNLVGSLAFGVAAIAARYLDTTGEPANISAVNLGTFVGAVCFLAGALLLPVQSAKEYRAAVAASSG
jgi:hypothetical protein